MLPDREAATSSRFDAPSRSPLSLPGFPMPVRRLLYCLPVLAACCGAPVSRAADADPPRVGPERLARIDVVVQQALDRGELPGAVVLVVHRDAVVFRKAYGLRSKQPAETPMTADTVFDLAS